ncbi:FecR family protein [Novosphingobium sp. KA1]|uniref:FecR family protein n=1 Tax=Novosphingobium sp. (strain KA1) TaxID=164608 RepID=UPI001A8CEF45|nr:FecR domain-containing protein [Novosphingobium sp. KA1]QSR19814.1 hypothetical protein CA833_21965 [Novosphingobium sp. KA1]
MTVRITRAELARLSPGEAAALWQVQRDTGSPVEAGLFDEWLAADAANAAAWERLGSAWSLFEDADDPLFAELRREALAAGPQDGVRSAGGLWKHALAACLVLGLVAGAVLFFGRSDWAPAGPDMLAGEESGQRYTAPEASRTFALADGTQMTLARGSAARVAFAGGERRVFLDRGQARFSVTHDARHRFKVMAGRWSVVDFGTRFEIGIAGDELRVALFEGSVQVAGNGNPPTMLVPGKQLVARTGMLDTVSDIGTAGASAAHGGLAEFEDVALSEAVKRFNALNVVQLVIVDPRAGALRITGQFRLDDPLRFARTIAQFLPVRVSRVKADRIEIGYRGR